MPPTQRPSPPPPPPPAEPHPLGRHPDAGPAHDVRSRLFPLLVTASPVDVRWNRRVPIFDQGDLGSCTGNALVGALGTDPLFDTLGAAQRNALTEETAVGVYSAATKIDPFDGEYPPTDTGSDGLSVAKIAKARGWVSGYLHAFDLNSALAAIALRPVITGVNWYSSWDRPDASGRVTISPDADVRGGHEFEILGVDTTKRTVRAANSWGEEWGDLGYFEFSWDDWDRLLHEEGDVTQVVPLTAPAPVPVPPTPIPGEGPSDADRALWAAVRDWAHARHVGSNRRAAQAVLAWAASLNLT